MILLTKLPLLVCIAVAVTALHFLASPAFCTRPMRGGGSYYGIGIPGPNAYPNTDHTNDLNSKTNINTNSIDAGEGDGEGDGNGNGNGNGNSEGITVEGESVDEEDSAGTEESDPTNANPDPKIGGTGTGFNTQNHYHHDPGKGARDRKLRHNHGNHHQDHHAPKKYSEEDMFEENDSAIAVGKKAAVSNDAPLARVVKSDESNDRHKPAPKDHQKSHDNHTASAAPEAPEAAEAAEAADAPIKPTSNDKEEEAAVAAAKPENNTHVNETVMVPESPAAVAAAAAAAIASRKIRSTSPPTPPPPPAAYDKFPGGFLQINNLPAISRLCAPIFKNFPPSLGERSPLGTGENRFYATFRSSSVRKGAISFVFYKYSDIGLIGRQSSDGDALADSRVLCDAADAKVDSTCEPGLFYIKPNANHSNSSSLRRGKLEVPDVNSTLADANVTFSDLDTGMYCLIWHPDANLSSDQGNAGLGLLQSYEAVSSTGFIPARMFPMLLLAVVIMLIYSCAFLTWVVQAIRYRREILPVQHYISAILAVVLFDSVMSLISLVYWNKTGQRPLPLLLASTVFSSLRISLSFFVLLLICLGYNVVKPSLGTEMGKCRALGMIHFFMLMLYSGLLFTDTQSYAPGFLLSLVIIIPLWLVTSAIFTMALSALAGTMEYLRVRRQEYKLRIYRRLREIIGFAAFGFVFIVVFNVVWQLLSIHESFDAQFWRYSYLVNEGAMSILYCLCVVSVAYQWLPTQRNSRYGLEELVSDPLEAEFDFNESAAAAAATVTETAASTSHGVDARLLSVSTLTSAAAAAADQTSHAHSSATTSNFGSSTIRVNNTIWNSETDLTTGLDIHNHNNHHNNNNNNENNNGRSR